MHYFRAFAIINIVLVHTLIIPQSYRDSTKHSVLWTAREMLFHDSTIYFIFISGFLFHYLSYSFKAEKYYRNKLKNVISPYIFWSIVVYSVKCYLEASTFSLAVLKHQLITGTALTHYWYIPFISLVFLISPLLLKINRKSLTVICLVTSFLPLLGTRTGTLLTLGQYMYFLPIYMVGIVCSIHYDSILNICRKNNLILMFILIITSVSLQYILHNKIYLKYGQINLIESIFYLQKMSATFLIILLFNLIKNKHTIPDLIANFSFGLYFTHTIFHEISILKYLIDMTQKHIPITITVIIYAVFSMFLTLGILYILKRILGQHSRMIIGA